MTRDLAARVRALPDVVARTRRLDLVWPTPGREAELLRLLSEPSISRWTGSIPYPYTPAHAREFLRRARRTRRTGSGILLQIIRRKDGALLGGAGLHNLVGRDRRSAEVGYWLGREFRGEGFTSEAVGGILELAFGRLGLHRVYATVFPRNRASIGVLRANGFRYEGRIRDEIIKDGRWRSVVLWSRLASDPPPPRASPRPRRGRPAHDRGGRTR
jgi:[ribosomal protein S5]-alanine N-acetyltransferase